MLRPNIVLEKKRPGRGFSTVELDAAGLNWHQARLLGIAIDKRRRSKHDENVKVLQYLKAEAQKTAKGG